MGVFFFFAKKKIDVPGSVYLLGHVHTYPGIFFSANIFLRMRKFSRPHAAYSNRFQPSTRIRLYPEIF